jgi:hypothetical protein
MQGEVTWRLNGMLCLTEQLDLARRWCLQNLFQHSPIGSRAAFTIHIPLHLLQAFRASKSGGVHVMAMMAQAAGDADNSVSFIMGQSTVLRLHVRFALVWRVSWHHCVRSKHPGKVSNLSTHIPLEVTDISTHIQAVQLRRIQDKDMGSSTQKRKRTYYPSRIEFVPKQITPCDKLSYLSV